MERLSHVKPERSHRQTHSGNGTSATRAYNVEKIFFSSQVKPKEYVLVPVLVMRLMTPLDDTDQPVKQMMGTKVSPWPVEARHPSLPTHPIHPSRRASSLLPQGAY